MSLICYEFTIFVFINMSLICTAGALNSRGHYVSGMGTDQLNALRIVFERMTNLDTAVAALSEAQTFYANASSFSSPLAHKMAVDGKMSSGMHLFQIYFIATDVLTSKLMTCSYHF
jgi:Na+-translocating ferredoxin:NAD+ oxidoreductase RnfD subunit